MQLFYSTYIADDKIILPEEEAKHCTRVLRKKIGDEVLVTDGMGSLYTTTIIDDAVKSCVLSVNSVQHTASTRKYKLHIAVAPTKNTARIEWLLEKLVEIGVDEISFLVCKHSEKQHLRQDRLQRILITAMKQSLNLVLPKLNDTVPLTSFFKTVNENQRLIAWCETGQEAYLATQYRAGADVVLLIGPEGDFTEEEVKEALTSGFVPVSLGEQRFRTETAAMVAAQIIHVVNALNK